MAAANVVLHVLFEARPLGANVLLHLVKGPRDSVMSATARVIVVSAENQGLPGSAVAWIEEQR